MVVTCADGAPVLPEHLWDTWLPTNWQTEFAAGAEYGERLLEDGTRVILLAEANEAETVAALRAVLDD